MPKMPIKKVMPSERQIKFRERVIEMLRSEFGNDDGIEMFVVTAQLLGQLMALQDQTKWTPATILQLMTENIEAGNKQVIEQLVAAPTPSDRKN